MTSGTFRSIPIDSITFNREARQRSELRGIDELAASIASTGLINPIVVTPDHILVAGERRLTACIQLGWTTILAHLTTDLSPLELQLIELEENVKRVDLPWQDQVRAVQRYHDLCRESDPEWTQEDTGRLLNIEKRTISNYLAVAGSIDQPEVAEAKQYSVALGLISRRAERALIATKRAIIASVMEPELAFEDTTITRTAQLLCQDFLTWTPGGARYNLIHCDFPYGLNMERQTTQGKAHYHSTYPDSADVYWQLLEHLCHMQAKFLDDQAHMVFWLSLKYFQETKARLEESGWSVSPFPLIWHKSDNAGLLPDPQRQPRRTYEAALFCTHGDRKIVRPVANSVAAPTTKLYHMSEKPLVVLEHFFRMLVDESTTLLDPTCGGGNAIRVAEELGAASAVGLELLTEFYDKARDNLKFF